MGNKTIFYTKISYTGMCCVILEAQDFEWHGRELAASKCNYKVLTLLLAKVFACLSLSPPHCLQGQSLALAYMLTIILWDPEDHLQVALN